MTTFQHPMKGLTVQDAPSQLFTANKNGSQRMGISPDQAADIFFGKKLVNKISNDDDEFPAENRTFAETVTGDSPKLTRLMITTITSDETFIFQYCLNWKHTNSTTIQMSSIEYNDGMLDRLPEESVASLLTEFRESSSVEVPRYGKAAHFSEDFYESPAGILDFQCKLQQLYNSTITTVIVGAFRELLVKSTPISVHAKYLDTGSKTRADVRDAFQTELDSWAITQRVANGLQIAIDNANTSLRSQSGKTATCIIVPSGAARYIANCANIVPHMARTQDGNVDMKALQKGITTSDGASVFQSFAIKSGPHDPGVDPFKRRRTIGTFNHMTAELLRDVQPQAFSTHMLDMKVFSEDKNDFVVWRYVDVAPLMGLYSGWRKGDNGGDKGPELKITSLGTQWMAGSRTWGEFLRTHGYLEYAIKAIKAKKNSAQIAEMMRIVAPAAAAATIATQPTNTRNANITRSFTPAVSSDQASGSLLPDSVANSMSVKQSSAKGPVGRNTTTATTAAPPQFATWLRELDVNNGTSLAEEVNKMTRILQSERATMRSMDIPSTALASLASDFLHLDVQRAIQYATTQYGIHITEFEQAHLTAYQRNVTPARGILAEASAAAPYIKLNDDAYVARIVIHPCGQLDHQHRASVRYIDLDFAAALCSLTSSALVLIEIDRELLYSVMTTSTVQLSIAPTSAYSHSADRRIAMQISILISCMLRRIQMCADRSDQAFVREVDGAQTDDAASTTHEMRIRRTVRDIMTMGAMIRGRGATMDRITRIVQSLDTLYCQVFCTSVVQSLTALMLTVRAAYVDTAGNKSPDELDERAWTAATQQVNSILAALQQLAAPTNSFPVHTREQHFLTRPVAGLTTLTPSAFEQNARIAMAARRKPSMTAYIDLTTTEQAQSGTAARMPTTFRTAQLAEAYFDASSDDTTDNASKHAEFKAAMEKLSQFNRTASRALKMPDIDTFGIFTEQLLRCIRTSNNDNEWKQAAIAVHAAFNNTSQQDGPLPADLAALILEVVNARDNTNPVYIALQQQLTTILQNSPTSSEFIKAVYSQYVGEIHAALLAMYKERVDKQNQQLIELNQRLDVYRQVARGVSLFEPATSNDNVRDNSQPQQQQQRRKDIPDISADDVRVFLLEHASVKSGAFWYWCIHNDIPSGIFYLAARPHMQYRTGTMLSLHGGPGLGSTYWTKPGLSIGRNAANHTLSVHFKIWFASLVEDPKLLVRTHDVYVDAYHGGNGHIGWNPLSDADRQDYRTHSLNKSVFFLPMPPSQRFESSVIDIRGRFDEDLCASNDADETTEFYGSNIWAQHWNWNTSERGRVDADKIPYFRESKARSNKVCFQAHQQTHSTSTGGLTNIIFEQGHWGRNVYPGCAAARRGADQFILPINSDGTAVMRMVS